MNEAKTAALKARILARHAAPAPLTPDQFSRQQRLINAAGPSMFNPVPCRRFGPGYPKRLLRQLSRAYTNTHMIHADVCFNFTCSPDSLMQAVQNDLLANELLTKAKRLPHTMTGARARALACDNAGVARETLTVISNIVNRAPRLN